MLKRVWWIALLLMVGVTPVFAQEAPTSVDWIPADFAGFVRLSMADANETLTRLNIGLRVFCSPAESRHRQSLWVMRPFFHLKRCSILRMRLSQATCFPG
jgi:hypothetical protein